jgi:cryptochrome 1
MSASTSTLSGGAVEAAMRTVVWFRRDLRVEDNPALAAAARTAGEVVPAYVWAPEEDGPYYPGRVSRWWLSQSLKHLDASLRRLGASRLVTRRSADTVDALLELVRSTGATHLFFNHLYGSIPLSLSLCCYSRPVIFLLFLQTYDFPVEILELFGPLALYFFLEPRALALLN